MAQLGTERDYYDIHAKIAPEDIAEWQRSRTHPEVYQAMLQRTLEERFKLSVIACLWQRDGWALVVAEKARKLKEATSEEQSGTRPRNSIPVGPGGWMVLSRADRGDQLKFTAASVASVAELMSNDQGGTVVDQTGLTGKYDFTIFRSDDVPMKQSSDPRFWNWQQLGLELKPIKISSYTLVIDHIEKPSADDAQVTDASLMR